MLANAHKWFVVLGAVAVLHVAAGLTPATAQSQLAKLLASDGAANTEFGFAVAISGETAVIGACKGDVGGTDAGAAYVFQYDGSSWAQQAKLLPSDAVAWANFGYSVAIDGDIVVVGAYWDDDNGARSGSAYVFVKPTGGWADMGHTAKLKPSDGAAYDHFGISVGVSGDTVVVGSEWDGDNGARSGSAYVFVKPTAGWADMSQTAKLLPSDGGAYEHFGYSAAIDGDTVVVGAEWDNQNGDRAGAAYVFKKPVSGWISATETAKLTASDGGAYEHLGFSAAVSGDTVVVGSRWDNDNGARSGSAFVFEKPATGWTDMTETAKLLASDGEAYEEFGHSVAIDGDFVVVGAYWDDDNGARAGSAYVFQRPATGWANMTETGKMLAADGAAYDDFGCAVGLSGDTAVIGAHWDDDGGSNAGSAYVFWVTGSIINTTTGEAYRDLQEAMDAADPGEEIVLGPGTYTGLTDIDFGGKDIILRSSDPNDPNVVAATIIDPNQAGRAFNFHGGESPNAVLDGFTITNGRAASGTYATPSGGAILCTAGSSPTISKCRIIGNSADSLGGGIYCDHSNPTITECAITENSAEDGGGIWWSLDSGAPTIGLGSGNSPTIRNCRIGGNSANGHGGGVGGDDADGQAVTIMNAIIRGNTAGIAGGGVCGRGELVIINCTVVGNKADNGAGGGNGGGIYTHGNGHLTLTNSIVWANLDLGGTGTGESAQVHAADLAPTVNYCCIQGWTGGLGGTGNHGDDPAFLDPDGPDDNAYTWKDNDYHITPNSPCLDVGDPNGDYTNQTDIDNDERVMGPKVDMGADEHPVALLSLSVNWGPFGTVGVDPNQATYVSGRTVTLMAYPEPGMVFLGWMGDVPEPNASDNPLVVTMDSDKEIQAVFFLEERPTCGSGAGMPLAVAMGLLGVARLRRRR